MKPAVLPGEKMKVRLIKPGEDPGQGVGYLDDGTMVVVEAGREHLNEEVEFTVTNTRQTSAGKMIFGRMGDEPPAAAAAPHAATAPASNLLPPDAAVRRHPARRGELVAASARRKLVQDLAGVPVIARAVLPFVQRPDTHQILIAVPNDPFATATPAQQNLARLDDPVSQRAGERDLGRAVARAGGEESARRADRARARRADARRERLVGAERVPADVEWVAIHDAARPLVSQELIDRTLAAASSTAPPPRRCRCS